MCHASHHRMNPSCQQLLPVDSLQYTERYPRTSLLHEQQWIEDDARLEFQCLGDEPQMYPVWIEMSPRKFSSSNRLVMAMIFAAAVLRVRSK